MTAVFERAIAHLEAAKRCFPYLVGKNSPYVKLATLYQVFHLREAELADAAAELAADYQTWAEGVTVFLCIPYHLYKSNRIISPLGT